MYLTSLTSALSPLPDADAPLSLHFEVAVADRSHLSQHHDLENYLTPLFGRRWLDANRFVHVSATKGIGGTSRIRIGIAESANLSEDWTYLGCSPGAGTGTPAWKTRIHESLSRQVRSPLPDGPVEMHLAWHCSSKRNWVSLWKPTGDAMSPVLGNITTGRAFSPRDDRIVSLQLHRTVDDRMGHDVDVGMWWKS
jgi:hypothetical protein